MKKNEEPTVKKSIRIPTKLAETIQMEAEKDFDNNFSDAAMQTIRLSLIWLSVQQMLLDNLLNWKQNQMTVRSGNAQEYLYPRRMMKNN